MNISNDSNNETFIKSYVTYHYRLPSVTFKVISAAAIYLRDIYAE